MPVKQTKKIMFLTIGWISLLLGFIGIFLPILPTTPFAILSAWCFSKSSERLHNWLLSNRTLGPLIKDWERYGVIRMKAKILSTVMIVLLFSYTLIFVKVNLIIKSIVSLIGISVLTFIWTRPSEPVENLVSADQSVIK